jgi:hypothetical protein
MQQVIEVLDFFSAGFFERPENSMDFGNYSRARPRWHQSTKLCWHSDPAHMNLVSCVNWELPWIAHELPQVRILKELCVALPSSCNWKGREPHAVCIPPREDVPGQNIDPIVCSLKILVSQNRFKGKTKPEPAIIGGKNNGFL